MTFRLVSSRAKKSFCVTGAILLRRFQKMTSFFRGRRSTLQTSIVILRGRRSTLDVPCCVFFANRTVKAASSGENVHTAWQVWDIVRVSFCVAGSAAFEEDPALHTLRFTRYTLTVHVSRWFICVSFFVGISSQHGMSTTSAATSMMVFSLSVSTTVPLT